MQLYRSLRGKIIDVTTYVVAIAIFLLFFGRFIGLPLFLAAIVSPSMEPAIRIGDVVVVWRGDQYVTGDIVMWCSSPFYCVVHRVVEVGNAYVVTKGDANPVPDAPITSSAVVGKVVAVIPREVMMAVIVAFVAAQAWVKRKSLLRFSDPVSFLVYGTIAYLALSMIFILFFPAPAILEVGEFATPTVHLRKAVYENGSVKIEYGIQNTRLMDVLYCVAGASNLVAERCTAVVAGDNFIIVNLSSDLLEELNEQGFTGFWVTVVCSLWGNGTLKGNYTLTFYAEKLDVSIINNTLVIHNPNPFPVRYQLRLLYMNVSPATSVTNISTGTLPQFSTIEIEAGNWEYVHYRLTYHLMGAEEEVAGWIRHG